MKNWFKLCLLLATLVLVTGVRAQKKFKDYIVTGSAMFVSGMLDGTIEAITWHYEEGFRPRFRHINDRFWNPAISWRNKYRHNNPAEGPKFFGSTTVFAFTTDAYHMLRTTNRAINLVTLVDYVDKNCNEKNKRKCSWKVVAKDFLILTAIRSVGFTLTYGVIFRKANNGTF